MDSRYPKKRKADALSRCEEQQELLQPKRKVFKFSSEQFRTNTIAFNCREEEKKVKSIKKNSELLLKEEDIEFLKSYFLHGMLI